jgi:hypothetical protein
VSKTPSTKGNTAFEDVQKTFEDSLITTRK